MVMSTAGWWMNGGRLDIRSRILWISWTDIIIIAVAVRVAVILIDRLLLFDGLCQTGVELPPTRAIKGD